LLTSCRGAFKAIPSLPSTLCSTDRTEPAQGPAGIPTGDWEGMGLGVDVSVGVGMGVGMGVVRVE